MAKQNIKLTKSELEAHAEIMRSLEASADDQYNAMRATLDSIKGCFDSQLASAIDRSVSEHLKLYRNVSEHMHVGAWCISLVLKNSEVTDANCAAQIEKLIADPPPEKTIARCLYNGYNQYHWTGNLATRDGSYVFLWNTEGEQVSCTYHTLKRLRDKGLDYPFKDAGGSHGGGSWYTNCDRGLAEVREGYNAIEQLIQEYGVPLENVVIDFPPQVDRYGHVERYGHVMLIDRIYKDGDTYKVDFTEMINKDTGASQRDLNSNGFEHLGWSLEDFHSGYGGNGPIAAATLIGKAP